MHRMIPAGALCFAACATFLSGCATIEGGGQAFNILSVEEEQRLGVQLSQEVEQQEAVLNDAAVQQYVDEIGQRLVQQVERRDVAYQFKVIDAPDTINAFALPGGYMYIYTGLMKLCENEAQLASVMAHEIAHVSSHHHGEAMSRQYGYQLITSALLGQNPGQMAGIARDMAGTVGGLSFSREAERESDTRGMNYLVQAGYNPLAMVRFMERMMNATGGGGRGMPAFLSSHPATDERVSRLEAQARQYPPNLLQSLPYYEDRYEAILQRLPSVPGEGMPAPAVVPAPAPAQDEWRVIQ